MIHWDELFIFTVKYHKEPMLPYKALNTAPNYFEAKKPMHVARKDTHNVWYQFSAKLTFPYSRISSNNPTLVWAVQR